MIEILTWTSILTGGFLVLMMFLSLIGGLDLDFDIGDTDLDSSGSLGLIKSFLTFVSVSSWVMKILMTIESSTFTSLVVGVISGGLAVVFLGWLFKLLLRNQENVNWKIEDTLFHEAKVYLKIPGGNKNGIIHTELNGAIRELKAVSASGELIETGDRVMIEDIQGNAVVVSPMK